MRRVELKMRAGTLQKSEHVLNPAKYLFLKVAATSVKHFNEQRD